MLCTIIVFLGCFIVFYGKHTFSIANPIIGENVRIANQREFPFIVTIGRKQNRTQPYNHLCMGALISLEHVLTAAHCLEDEEISNLQVTVGSVDLRKGKVYNVDSLITYREWQTRHKAVSFPDNDIAVLKLSKKVKEQGVKPVLYSTTIETTDYENQTVVTAGWGRMKDDKCPRKLRAANLHVLTGKQCKRNTYKATGKRRIPSKGLFCTNSKPHVVLGYGDSGGPVLLNGQIIGINDSTFPSVHYCPSIQTSLKINTHRAISFYIPFIEFALRL